MTLLDYFGQLVDHGGQLVDTASPSTCLCCKAYCIACGNVAAEAADLSLEVGNVNVGSGAIPYGCPQSLCDGFDATYLLSGGGSSGTSGHPPVVAECSWSYSTSSFACIPPGHASEGYLSLYLNGYALFNTTASAYTWSSGTAGAVSVPPGYSLVGAILQFYLNTMGFVSTWYFAALQRGPLPCAFELELPLIGYIGTTYDGFSYPANNFCDASGATVTASLSA
ncbi:MAG TPA: hypothetical protein VMF30_02005 [Pirellulales bacterium]|nr:hypothetical protein [Pirellulales bacterium]